MAYDAVVFKWTSARANGFLLLVCRVTKTEINSNKQQRHRRNQVKFNKWTVELAAADVVSFQKVNIY
jgi:hypothetical protein